MVHFRSLGRHIPGNVMGGQHVEHFLVAGMPLANGLQSKSGQIRKYFHGSRVQGLVYRNAVRIIFQFVFQSGKLGSRVLLEEVSLLVLIFIPLNSPLSWPPDSI